MRLDREEATTVKAVLNAIINEMPYREVNKYLGDMTLDRANELLDRITKVLNCEVNF